MEDSLG